MTTPPPLPINHPRGTACSRDCRGYPHAEDTPPPPLPSTLDYHAMITTLEALLPGFNPQSVMWLNITPREVRVAYWDGTRERMHVARITHRQGSSTEGGTPTPTTTTHPTPGDTQP